MTVSVPGQLTYSTDGDGVTTSFSYPVRFLAKAEIKVYLRENGVNTLQVLNTHYTIAGSSWPSGGNIVFLTPPTALQKVVRYRDTAATQTVDLANTQRNDAPAAEVQFDRHAMVEQDIKEQVGRSWKADFGSVAGNIVPGANNTVGVWSDGNLIDGGPTVSKIAQAAALAPLAIAAAEAALAAVPSVYVNSLSALKAIPQPTVHGRARLEESGKQGNFTRVLAATFAALIAADTDNAVIAQSTVDPTYAYMRDLDSENLLRGNWAGILSSTGEQTARIQALSDVGRLLGKGLSLPAGVLTATALSQINLTGLPELNLNNTVLDLSASTLLAPLAATGAKTLLKSNVTLANGAGEIDITGNATVIEKGDTILITSAEQHPNWTVARPYFKGTRTYCDAIVHHVAFDAQTANFTLGATVTQAVSGATGIIASQTDAGATGTLVLRDVVGTFVDNQLVTDGVGGSAMANIPTGALRKMRVYPQVDWSYAGTAYVWKATENPIRITGTGRIKGNRAVNQAGLIFSLCDWSIGDDITLTGFPQAAVSSRASRGKFRGRILYPYLPGNGTNYGVGVFDLSDVDVQGALCTGARHALTVGGGTFDVAEAGGAPGAASYPSTLKVTGGTYGSSRSSNDYANDPSLETGPIDCHAIAKALIVTGTHVYGGLKIAPIESCVITGNTIASRNYAIVTFVDAVAPLWGSLVFAGNDCQFIGDLDSVSLPNSSPEFFRGGSTDFFRSVSVTGNRFACPAGALTGTVSLGILRNPTYLDFSNNVFDITRAAASTDVSLTFYAGIKTTICDNKCRNVRLSIIPNSTVTVLNCSRNEVTDTGDTGINLINNSIATASRFAAAYLDDNIFERTYNAGLYVRGDVILRLFLTGNKFRNCNVAGGANATTGSAFVLARIVAATDPLELLVMIGNMAMSTSDVAYDHYYGFWAQTGTGVNTDVILKDNTSIGHTISAFGPVGALGDSMDATGNTVIEQVGNTGLINLMRAPDGITTYRPVETRVPNVFSSNVDFSLLPNVSTQENIHTGTLTANRTITLSVVGAIAGITRFRVTRTGGGAFTLSVGGLKLLSTNQWCEVVYNGTNYTLVAYGTL